MENRSAKAIGSTDWYRIKLSRDDFEGGEVGVIQGAFQQIYIASNAPKGMAMLGASAEDGDAYFIYFTPRSLPYARALVKAYSAVPQTEPAQRELALIFGDASDSMQVGRQF